MLGRDIAYAKIISGWGLNRNLGLSYSDVDVYFRGTGGLKLCSEQPHKSMISLNHTRIIKLRQPEGIYIEIGSNDLCDESVIPSKLARQAVAFAKYLISAFEVKCVIFGSILPRVHDGIPNQGYNSKVMQFNNALQTLVSTTPGISLWKHRGFYHSDKWLYCPDGVHLNFWGKGKYACSLKRAVTALIKQIGG